MDLNDDEARHSNSYGVGIVAVHGVIPQIRYGFQDEVATNLCRVLNERDTGTKKRSSSDPWSMCVVLPSDGAVDVQDVPTISRVYRGDDGTAPDGMFFDVHEAFWSPIDKGRTNLVSVLLWLVATVFTPFNTLACYRELLWKALWDIFYILLAIALGIIFLLYSGVTATNLLRDLLCQIHDPLTHATLTALPTVDCSNRVNVHDIGWVWNYLKSSVTPRKWGSIFD